MTEDEQLRKECEQWLTKNEVMLAPNGRHYNRQVVGLMALCKRQQAVGLREAAMGIDSGDFIPVNGSFNIGATMPFIAWAKQWCESQAKEREG